MQEPGTFDVRFPIKDKKSRKSSIEGHICPNCGSSLGQDLKCGSCGLDGQKEALKDT